MNSTEGGYNRWQIDLSYNTNKKFPLEKPYIHLVCFVVFLHLIIIYKRLLSLIKAKILNENRKDIKGL